MEAQPVTARPPRRKRASKPKPVTTYNAAFLAAVAGKSFTVEHDGRVYVVSVQEAA